MKLRSGKKYTNLHGPARANRTISMLGQPSSQLPKSLTIRLNARLRKKKWLTNSNLISKLSIPMSAVSRDTLLENFEWHEIQFNAGRLPISYLDAEGIAGELAKEELELRCDTFEEMEQRNGESTAWFEFRKETAYQKSRAPSVKSQGYGWKGWDNGNRVPSGAEILKRRGVKKGQNMYGPEWLRPQSPFRELGLW